MQAIFESVFDIAYLAAVLATGILMMRKSKDFPTIRLFGWMAVVLGAGDAFHLVPRVFALIAGDMAAFAVPLGIGKLVTSITMTFFYALLFHVWRRRYGVRGATGLKSAVYALAAVRVALCLFPGNQWTQADSSYVWGIWRNIPFVLLGALMIALFIQKAAGKRGDAFRHMWLAITLSFAFYIPVVLFADRFPVVGMLMIPKTIAYLWIVWMGYSDMNKTLSKARA